MPKIIFILVVFLFFQSLTAQITIAPEVGIYHRPYLFSAVSNGVNQNKLEYYAGIMGEVRLLPKLYAQTRMAYVWKEDIESYWIMATPPELDYVVLRNKELTFNVDILYEPLKRTKIGAGLGLINKLDSYLFEKYFYKESAISYYNRNTYYTASVVIDYSWKRFGMNARLFYLLSKEELNTNANVLGVGILDNNRGMTLGINYRLIGYEGNKRKK